MMQDGAHDDHGHGLADDLAQMRKLAGEAMGRRRTSVSYTHLTLPTKRIV